MNIKSINITLNSECEYINIELDLQSVLMNIK